MMHGQGKSDSSIVPAKSSNKAALAAAETMEGRGGTKGNAVRGSTCQTQSWESVSLALDRIRETARRAVSRDDPRWEPSAVVPLAGFCAGGGEQSPSLPRRVSQRSSAGSDIGLSQNVRVRSDGIVRPVFITSKAAARLVPRSGAK